MAKNIRKIKKLRQFSKVNKQIINKFDFKCQIASSKFNTIKIKYRKIKKIMEKMHSYFVATIENVQQISK
jgi:hypothetical protein